jgi:predicted transposase/invertase (TIGR01784 family)
LASDKLFYFLFHNSPDLILRWLEDLPADAGGYRFSAPVLKEREYRLDGLFSPPQQRDDLPAVVLEAQMQEDPEFWLRLYAESGRFLQQERWQRDWRVVLIAPHRQMEFGALTPVREFVEHRVRWVELQPRDGEPPAEPLTQALSLLLQPESQVRSVSDALHRRAQSDASAAEVLPLIPAILLARFNKRPLQEICTMAGITLEDFTQSRAYQEIYGLGKARGEARGRQEGLQEGRQEGLQKGRQAEAAAMALRLLKRRCGPLSAVSTARIEALPLEQLEALAEALLDFSGPADLTAWLAANS